MYDLHSTIVLVYDAFAMNVHEMQQTEISDKNASMQVSQKSILTHDWMFLSSLEITSSRYMIAHMCMLSRVATYFYSQTLTFPLKNNYRYYMLPIHQNIFWLCKNLYHFMRIISLQRHWVLLLGVWFYQSIYIWLLCN